MDRTSETDFRNTATATTRSTRGQDFPGSPRNLVGFLQISDVHSSSSTSCRRSPFSRQLLRPSMSGHSAVDGKGATGDGLREQVLVALVPAE